MTNKNIIRAWKDEAYRTSLSEAERAMLPENPAGKVELTDAQLEAAGAMSIETYFCTLGCTYDSKCPTAWCTFGCIKF